MYADEKKIMKAEQKTQETVYC